MPIKEERVQVQVAGSAMGKWAEKDQLAPWAPLLGVSERWQSGNPARSRTTKQRRSILLTSDLKCSLIFSCQQARCIRILSDPTARGWTWSKTDQGTFPYVFYLMN